MDAEAVKVVEVLTARCGEFVRDIAVRDAIIIDLHEKLAAEQKLNLDLSIQLGLVKPSADAGDEA